MISLNIQIEKLQKKDIEKVATMLADTFTSNPAYTLISTRKDKLRDGLIWLFKTNLFLLNQRMLVTNVLKERGAGNIIGIYSLLPPGGVKSKLKDYLQIGLPLFIF